MEKNKTSKRSKRSPEEWVNSWSDYMNFMLKLKENGSVEKTKTEEEKK